MSTVSPGINNLAKFITNIQVRIGDIYCPIKNEWLRASKKTFALTIGLFNPSTKIPCKRIAITFPTLFDLLNTTSILKLNLVNNLKGVPIKRSIVILTLTFLLSACGTGLDTGKPNSGVIPKPLDRDGNGSLIYDTEKLPMTGQWCHEIDHEYRRIGSPSNCVANY